MSTAAFKAQQLESSKSRFSANYYIGTSIPEVGASIINDKGGSRSRPLIS